MPALEKRFTFIICISVSLSIWAVSHCSLAPHVANGVGLISARSTPSQLSPLYESPEEKENYKTWQKCKKCMTPPPGTLPPLAPPFQSGLLEEQILASA